MLDASPPSVAAIARATRAPSRMQMDWPPSTVASMRKVNLPVWPWKMIERMEGSRLGCLVVCGVAQ